MARSAAVTGRLLPYGWSGDPHVTGPASRAAPARCPPGTEGDCAKPCARNRTQADPAMKTELPDLIERMSLLTFCNCEGPLDGFKVRGKRCRPPALSLITPERLKPSFCHEVAVSARPACRAAGGVREPDGCWASTGESLLRRRGELIERSFAHCYETGGMRRCHCSSRTGEHSEAAAGPCSERRFEPDSAQAAGSGYAARAEKSRRTNVFATFALFVVLDGGRFLHPATQSPDSPADGTIFPVPHTSSPLRAFSVVLPRAVSLVRDSPD